MFCTYKQCDCLQGKVSCVQATTDIAGSDNVVNIKKHNNNKNLAMAQVDMPLGKLNFPLLR
jgi:hypothetical protein